MVCYITACSRIDPQSRGDSNRMSISSTPKPLTVSKRKSPWVNIALMGVSIGLLGVVIFLNRVQLREVLSRPIDPNRFGLAFLFLLTALICTFTRWFSLARALDLPVTWFDAIKLGFIGNLWNLIIPGAVGGDAIKGVYVCRGQARSRKTHAIASIVLDRILGLLGLFLLAAVTGLSAWSKTGTDVHRLVILAWIAVICGMTGLTVVFTPALYRPLNRMVAEKKKLAKILAELESMASAYRDRIWVVAAALLGSMGIHALLVTSFYIVGTALFPTIPSLSEHFVIVPLVLFTTAVPLPFGALGVSEEASAKLFELVGHPGGAIAMMGFRIVMYAGGALSALVYLANMREVKSLQNEKNQLPADPVPNASTY